ncbi:exodeoxyribonuclease VII small subunit [Burkholderiaceae bacterium DAT-1]|nr:exodeoxyribonuclease VII small subunit [Burkholderiaceae bacterium DAT-1]
MAKQPAPKSFETALSELETLIADMERGEMTLDASLSAYQRGGELVRYCQGQLEAAERQVEVLDGDMLKPLDTAPAQES